MPTVKPGRVYLLHGFTNSREGLSHRSGVYLLSVVIERRKR